MTVLSAYHSLLFFSTGLSVYSCDALRCLHDSSPPMQESGATGNIQPYFV